MTVIEVIDGWLTAINRGLTATIIIISAFAHRGEGAAPCFLVPLPLPVKTPKDSPPGGWGVGISCTLTLSISFTAPHISSHSDYHTAWSTKKSGPIPGTLRHLRRVLNPNTARAYERVAGKKTRSRLRSRIPWFRYQPFDGMQAHRKSVGKAEGCCMLSGWKA